MQNKTSFFYNRTLNKNELKRLVQWSTFHYGMHKTTKFVEKLKDLGFYYSTKSGVSLSIDDLKIPPAKDIVLQNANREAFYQEENFTTGKLSLIEKFQKNLEIWNTASELLKDEAIHYFKKTDLVNPIYMMAFSGARANMSQVRQLVGMRGLMSNSQGDLIDLPITSNFREGLTLTEYIISCYGARKGLIDTALRTANAGYLTRRLVDVAHGIIIRTYDCKTIEGLSIDLLQDENKIYISRRDRLVGRVLAKLVSDQNVKIGLKNQQIDLQLATKLTNFKPSKVLIRSPLICKEHFGMCALCYGWNLETGRLVQSGEAVGILAAQSIGEPGTQLTLRTFHTGGVFSGKIIDRFYSPLSGFLSYTLNSLDLKQVNKQKFYITTKEKEIYIGKQKFIFPPSTIIYFKPDIYIFEKQMVAELFSSNLEKSSQSFSTITIRKVFSKNFSELSFFLNRRMCQYSKNQKRLSFESPLYIPFGLKRFHVIGEKVFFSGFVEKVIKARTSKNINKSKLHIKKIDSSGSINKVVSLSKFTLHQVKKKFIKKGEPLSISEPIRNFCLISGHKNTIFKDYQNKLYQNSDQLLISLRASSNTSNKFGLIKSINTKYFSMLIDSFNVSNQNETILKGKEAQAQVANQRKVRSRPLVAKASSLRNDSLYSIKFLRKNSYSNIFLLFQLKFFLERTKKMKKLFLTILYNSPKTKLFKPFFITSNAITGKQKFIQYYKRLNFKIKKSKLNFFFKIKNFSKAETLILLNQFKEFRNKIWVYPGKLKNLSIRVDSNQVLPTPKAGNLIGTTEVGKKLELDEVLNLLAAGHVVSSKDLLGEGPSAFPTGERNLSFRSAQKVNIIEKSFDNIDFPTKVLKLSEYFFQQTSMRMDMDDWIASGTKSNEVGKPMGKGKVVPNDNLEEAEPQLLGTPEFYPWRFDFEGEFYETSENPTNVLSLPKFINEEFNLENIFDLNFNFKNIFSTYANLPQKLNDTKSIENKKFVETIYHLLLGNKKIEKAYFKETLSIFTIFKKPLQVNFNQNLPFPSKSHDWKGLSQQTHCSSSKVPPREPSLGMGRANPTVGVGLPLRLWLSPLISLFYQRSLIKNQRKNLNNSKFLQIKLITTYSNQHLNLSNYFLLEKNTTLGHLKSTFNPYTNQFLSFCNTNHGIFNYIVSKEYRNWFSLLPYNIYGVINNNKRYNSNRSMWSTPLAMGATVSMSKSFINKELISLSMPDKKNKYFITTSYTTSTSYSNPNISKINLSKINQSFFLNRVEKIREFSKRIKLLATKSIKPKNNFISLGDLCWKYETFYPINTLLTQQRRFTNTSNDKRHNFLSTNTIYPISILKNNLSLHKSNQLVLILPNKIFFNQAEFYINEQNIDYQDKELIDKGQTLLNFEYSKQKTGDIVQGLPKIEQLLEARSTQNARPLPNNVNLLLGLKLKNYSYKIKTSNSIKLDRKNKLSFFLQDKISEYDLLKAKEAQSTKEILKDRNLNLVQFRSGKIPKNDYRPRFSSPKKSIDIPLYGIIQSTKEIQKYLVDSLQLVYQSQGVDISDKHIEIIVRQMTSKVTIKNPDVTAYLLEEYIERTQLSHFFYHKLSLALRYEPVVLGITKVALNTNGFLSAASFQETVRILTTASLLGKRDWLRGLKEKVIVGQVIRAGTGIIEDVNLQPSMSLTCMKNRGLSLVSNNILSAPIKQKIIINKGSNFLLQDIILKYKYTLQLISETKIFETFLKKIFTNVNSKKYNKILFIICCKRIKFNKLTCLYWLYNKLIAHELSEKPSDKNYLAATNLNIFSEFFSEIIPFQSFLGKGRRTGYDSVLPQQSQSPPLGKLNYLPKTRPINAWIKENKNYITFSSLYLFINYFSSIFIYNKGFLLSNIGKNYSNTLGVRDRDRDRQLQQNAPNKFNFSLGSNSLQVEQRNHFRSFDFVSKGSSNLFAPHICKPIDKWVGISGVYSKKHPEEIIGRVQHQPTSYLNKIYLFFYKCSGFLKLELIEKIIYKIYKIFNNDKIIPLKNQTFLNFLIIKFNFFQQKIKNQLHIISKRKFFNKLLKNKRKIEKKFKFLSKSRFKHTNINYLKLKKKRKLFLILNFYLNKKITKLNKDLNNLLYLMGIIENSLLVTYDKLIKNDLSFANRKNFNELCPFAIQQKILSNKYQLYSQIRSLTLNPHSFERTLKRFYKKPLKDKLNLNKIQKYYLLRSRFLYTNSETLFNQIIFDSTISKNLVDLQKEVNLYPKNKSYNSTNRIFFSQIRRVFKQILISLISFNYKSSILISKVKLKYISKNLLYKDSITFLKKVLQIIQVRKKNIYLKELIHFIEIRRKAPGFIRENKG